MPPRTLFPLDSFDPSNVLADIEAIRAENPQRFEMEQLTRICHFDLEAREVAGVLEIPEEPWWGPGHVPLRALMPGVLMLEAAAQLCSWAVHQVLDPIEGKIFGFGGLDNVKFRGAIFPPAELLLLGKAIDIRPRRAIFDTQGYVDGKMMFQAQITGLWV